MMFIKRGFIYGLILLVFQTCNYKKTMKDVYLKNHVSNVHWRFFIYDKKSFESAMVDVSKFNSRKNELSNILNAARLLVDSLDSAYARLREDNSFMSFMSFVNNGQDTKKYMELYYKLAKTKLSRIVENDGVC